MKRVSSKKYTVLLALGMSAITCMVCSLGGGMVTFAHKASAEKEVVGEQEEIVDDTIGDIDEGGISIASTCTPEKPILIEQSEGIYYEKYHCFVAYPIKNVDENATQLDFGKNNSAYNVYSVNGIEKNEVYRLVAAPSNTGTTSCTPSLYLVSAYCTTCKTRSAIDATIYNNYYTYHANCSYGITDKKIDGNIPTSYNQSGTNLNKWAHNLANGETIFFSIANNGVVADGKLFVPLLGYKSTSVTLDGITFTVRTGPSYLSIQASSTVICNTYDTMSAFYSC